MNRPTAWRLFALMAAIGSDGDGPVMTDVTAGASGVVGVGSDGPDGDFDAAVWLSPPPAGS